MMSHLSRNFRAIPAFSSVEVACLLSLICLIALADLLWAAVFAPFSSIGRDFGMALISAMACKAVEHLKESNSSRETMFDKGGALGAEGVERRKYLYKALGSSGRVGLSGEIRRCSSSPI